MVAGLIGPRDDDDDQVAPVGRPLRRRRGSTSRRRSGSPNCRSTQRSSSLDSVESPVPQSDVGTDDTNSDGGGAAAKAPVHHPLRDKAEYVKVFNAKPIHEAVLEAICRLARLMGKICGDNAVPGAMRTQNEAAELQQEAKLFVTRFVRVLFGAVSTTKMHRLAFHLMQELLLRGNFDEGDTSTNEMLHKLLKAMYRVTNKHPDNFQVQMMKCEQTLLHILAEDADIKLREAAPGKVDDDDDVNCQRRLPRRQGARTLSATAGRRAVKYSEATFSGSGDETGYEASDESDLGPGARQEHMGWTAGIDADQGTDASTVGSGSEKGYQNVYQSGSDGGCATDESCSDTDGSSSATAERDSVVGGQGSSSGSRDVGGSHSAGSATSSTGSCTTSPSIADSTDDPPVGVTPSSLPHVSGRGCKRAAHNVVVGGTRLCKRARAAAGRVGGRAAEGSAVRRVQVRIRGLRVTAAEVAGADGGRLQGLPILLHLRGTQTLSVVNSMTFDASFEWGAPGIVQRVRAARSLYNGTPWYDHVLIKNPASPAAPHLGLARLLIRAIDGERRDLVVVQLLEEADARPGCVLTTFGCGRRRWKMDAGTGFPALAAVPTASLQRLEHVVPDFEDLCDRLGLYATPATVPDTPHEMPLQRYFVNAFFPWTGGCEDDHL
mgnify:CR=1 FL=1